MLEAFHNHHSNSTRLPNARKRCRWQSAPEFSERLRACVAAEGGYLENYNNSNDWRTERGETTMLLSNGALLAVETITMTVVQELSWYATSCCRMLISAEIVRIMKHCDIQFTVSIWQRISRKLRNFCCQSSNQSWWTVHIWLSVAIPRHD